MTELLTTTCVTIWWNQQWSASLSAAVSGAIWTCSRLSKVAFVESVAVRLVLAKIRRGRTASFATTLFCSKCNTMATLCSARLATSGAVRLGFMAEWIIFWSTSTNTVTVPTTRLWSSTTFIKSSCALRWVRNAPLSSQTPRRPFQCSQSKQRRGMFVWPSCASQRSGALRTRRGEALLAQWRQLCHHRRRCGKSTSADSLTCSLTAQPAVFRTAPTARLRLKVLVVVVPGARIELGGPGARIVLAQRRTADEPVGRSSSASVASARAAECPRDADALAFDPVGRRQAQAEKLRMVEPETRLKVMAQRQPFIVPVQAEITAERVSAQRKRTQLASLPRTAPLDRTRLSGLSRAAWTPRERRLGRVDRGSRRAADGALPTARKSSPVAVGVEVFCGIMRLSRIGVCPRSAPRVFV